MDFRWGRFVFVGRVVPWSFPVWRCFGRLMAGSPLAAVRLAGFFPSGKGSRCRRQGRNIGGAEAGGVSAALVREKNNAAEQGKAVPKGHANFSQAIHIFFSSKKNVNLKRKIHPLQEGAVPLIVHGIRLFPKWDNLDLAMGFTGERELSLPIYIRFSRRHDNNPDSLALAIGIFRFCPSPDRPQYSSSQERDCPETQSRIIARQIQKQFQRWAVPPQGAQKRDGIWNECHLFFVPLGDF